MLPLIPQHILFLFYSVNMPKWWAIEAADS